MHSSGRMIDIADAENGLKCDCRCSCCGDRLVAKQGDFKDWHFAHESGADCAGAYESALHKAAKQILLDEKVVYAGKYNPMRQAVPDYGHLEEMDGLYGSVKAIEKFYDLKISDFPNYLNEELFTQLDAAISACSQKQMKLSDVVSERGADNSDLRPDITANMEDGSPLYIEVVVTHECDDNKIAQLKRLNVPTLEMNLAPLTKINFTLDDVREAVVNGNFGDLTPTFQRYGQDFTPKREWLVKPKHIQDGDVIANRIVTAITEALAERTRLAKLKRDEMAAKLESGEIVKTKVRVFNTTLVISDEKFRTTVWSPYVEKATFFKVEKVILSFGGKRGTTNWIIKKPKMTDALVAAFNSADEVAKEARRIERERIAEAVLAETARIEAEKHIRVNAMAQSIEREHARRLENINRINAGEEIHTPVREARAIADQARKAENERKRKLVKEVVDRHSKIVDHRFRTMMINAELAEAGLPELSGLGDLL